MVRTAVNPLLWLVGLVTPLAVAGATVTSDLWMRVALLTLAFLPVLFTILAYFVYMFRDPDRLQSEEYRLRQSALQLLVTKDSSAKVVDAATQIARVEKLFGGFGEGEEK
ncbi:MAG: hypothetical protein ACLPN5_22630 [Roseiarcus sp.]